MYLVKLTSCTLALPAPAPPPVWAEPEFDMPQDQASTSISSLCVLSFASPFRSPILMNISTAMTISSAAVWLLAAGVGRGQPLGLLSLVPSACLLLPLYQSSRRGSLPSDTDFSPVEC